MREIYSARYIFWLIVLLSGAIGCHQEPPIPASGIPKTCQVYSIANVNEGVHDTTYYRYNTFGYVDESTYRQWTNGRLTASLKQSFAYSADHFLTTQMEQSITYPISGNQTQESKNYTYTYQDGLVQQVAITNAQSGQALGFKLYTYENGNLKTYSETNAQKTPVRSYTFDGSGKLTQFTESGSDVTLTNGKITKRTLSDGKIINYQFDSQGQLTSEKTTSPTSQIERTYTYDNRPYWNKTQLLLRGIPSPDLGGHTNLHNIATSKLNEIQNGRTIRDQPFTYQYDFNKANYSIGYSRSDGFRQRIVYANCL
jgi:YD repeat-containing protein